MGKILRVNLTELKTSTRNTKKRYENMGGRWLTSSLVYDEVDPTCHPLGPNNKLVFSPGIITGTNAPSSGRLSVGGKSPLTNGIKESNAGTPFSQKLAKLGYDAVVVEGASNKNYWLLRINSKGALLYPAKFLGEGLYEAFPKVFTEFGENIGIAAIGVAGEQRLSNAGICFNDIDRRPSRYAGRGGLGAVMGSKGLKFIVVDDTGAPPIKLANDDVFRKGAKKLIEAISTHGVTKPGGTLNSYGTAALVNVLNEVGGFPTRNFREGRFEGAAKISGEAIAEICKTRGGIGKMGHACNPGCIIRCSNVYPKKDGSEHVSCIEYESAWAFGANCGIDNLDQVAEMIKQSNDYGVDTIEAGGAVAVAMEGGLAKFGDGEKAIELMKEIKKGTPIGKALGCGAATVGRILGVSHVPAVKGQNMPAYEPRAVKGIGVTYATSPMGADHTAGYTVAPEVLGVGGKLDPFSTDKIGLARAFQETTAFIDSTGYCLFIAFPVIDIPAGLEGVVETCNGMLGTKWTTDDVARIGKEILKKERAFNKAAGFTNSNDRLPEFMKYEKLPPHNTVFDVPDKDLDKVFNP